MRFISTWVHGVLDYVVGIFLLFAPRVFGFQNGGPEDRIFVFLGVATLIYSLLTRYELGLFKILRFRTHLTLDIINGALLAMSPWVFGFVERVWAPHLIIGLFELGVVLLTQPHTAETGLQRIGR